MSTPYSGVFYAEIPVLHEAWNGNTGSLDTHGNPIGDNSWLPGVDRVAISVHPLHKIPHHDPVGSDYVARTMIDFIMEVPNASFYHKNDRVTVGGAKYLVQGFPWNWGDGNPFGMDATMFGGSVHIERVA